MSEGGRASIKVEIAGEEYALRTNANEAYTRECAALVHDRMEEIRAGTGLDRQKAAILAALSLSDDVLQQRARVEGVKETVDEQVEMLADRLAEVLDAS